MLLILIFAFADLDRYRRNDGGGADKEGHPVVVDYYKGAPVWRMNFGMKYKIEGVLNSFLFLFLFFPVRNFSFFLKWMFVHSNDDSFKARGYAWGFRNHMCVCVIQSRSLCKMTAQKRHVNNADVVATLNLASPASLIELG